MNIQNYNTQETILAITSYPAPGDQETGQKSFNAVGWHSVKILGHLAKLNKVIVLAEKNGSQEDFAPRHDMRVVRLWEKGNIMSFVKLLIFILRLNKVQNIFIQFEFNVFGGTIPNLVILLMLFLLRLTGRRITFELHQVITDVGMLKKHIRLGTRPIELFFNLGLKCFYLALGLVANNIIVFEQALKDRLSRFVTKDKITALSIAVDRQKPLSKRSARKVLGLKDREFVILVFGFINGYKGIDWIVKATQGINKGQNLTDGRQVRLVIAGGKNPYLADTPHYQAFYQKVMRLIKKNKNIIHSGFVPDHEISTYFSACDVVSMPYEVFMSASGPFSLALSFGKPIILSDKLLPYSKSADFETARRLSGLTYSDIFFKLKKGEFQSFVHALKSNNKRLQNMSYFSKTLAKLRSSEYVVRDLKQVITTKNSPKTAQILSPKVVV